MTTRRRRRTPRSPLPQRHGLDAARLRTPAEGDWPTMRAHLVDRLTRVSPARIDELLAAGEIVGRDGPVAPDAPFVPCTTLWVHRDLPDEAPVPFRIEVLHRDDDIVVVDKPHFLATIPRGSHVRETVLVRLREELGLPELGAAHRLDRATAGVLLLVVRRELRGAYQSLFAKGRVGKTYEAVADHHPSLALPRTVRSRIVKHRGIVQARTEPGPVNAETRVELAGHRDGTARYTLRPRTGRTHQLRLHMSGLGVPILGDDFYPDLHERPLDDFTRPLQLLARTLEFTDPVTGEDRRFESRRTLQAWDDPDGWAEGTQPAA
ncbi:pseudouridine synthase [Pseudonocardia endophytica]|uniref:RNA pseudouridylate synthase n=1 Tax=Pseudonocardia endophytica TaxID=401976 RepID=A0A4V6NDF7_PSEEN|nr:pseudouridine synthase [Pseudonocardia endophytica]TCK22486.1 tRNA pseudouridine32 synthase/23S rRNA pseudouridine746 synthase [Pseudonocardia endophytica]